MYVPGTVPPAHVKHGAFIEIMVTQGFLVLCPRGSQRGARMRRQTCDGTSFIRALSLRFGLPAQSRVERRGHPRPGSLPLQWLASPPFSWGERKAGRTVALKTRHEATRTPNEPMRARSKSPTLSITAALASSRSCAGQSPCLSPASILREAFLGGGSSTTPPFPQLTAFPASWVAALFDAPAASWTSRYPGTWIHAPLVPGLDAAALGRASHWLASLGADLG
ncbi:hypothetical protein VTG60DRAFT_2637 [Thermothelomyces hinnuleus]